MILLRKQADQQYIAERAVTEHFRVPAEALLSKKRDRNYVIVRTFVWYFLSTRYGWSSPVVGECYGRDHSTILHAVEKVKADPRLRDELMYLVPRVEELETLFLGKNALAKP